MNLLKEIKKNKIEEVERRQRLYPQALLEEQLFYTGPTVSMKKYVLNPDKTGIIAEFKRATPSSGDLALNASVEKVSIGYMQSGASGLSILTDEHYFKGSLNDLGTARKFNFCPILRKDFIIDEYQLHESKAFGADAILLIAALLDPDETRFLTQRAHQLGMEVLLELHDIDELDKHYSSDIEMIGFNCRNLKDLSVKLERSLEAIPYLPPDACKIAESGIRHSNDLIQLRKAGYNGFLIGSAFMKHSRPEYACQKMSHHFKKLKREDHAATSA